MNAARWSSLDRDIASATDARGDGPNDLPPPERHDAQYEMQHVVDPLAFDQSSGGVGLTLDAVALRHVAIDALGERLRGLGVHGHLKCLGRTSPPNCGLA